MDLYEKYHSEPKLQKRIISDKNFTYRNLLDVLKNYLKSSKTILDIGCGVGTVDFYLASKGHRVTGIDISKTAISMARRNAEVFGVDDKTKFVAGNFPCPMIIGNYDLIVMAEVIEHLADDRMVLKETYNRLAKGGVLVLTTRSKNEVLYKLGLEKAHDKKVGHLRRYSIIGLRKLASDSGFKILELKKGEGVFRDSLFVYPFPGKIIVKLANRSGLLSDFLTFLDDMFLKLFGESQIYLVARKC